MIIYKTTNLINGKIYIGQDKYDRPGYLGSGLILNQALEKYGKENFVKETLEVCDSIEMMNEREVYWIKTLNSQDRNIGYNIASGGNQADCFTHHPNKEEIRRTCQLAKKDISKEVYQYDLEGNFIQKFESISQSSKALNILVGEISRCCNGKYKQCKGFIFKFYYEPNKDIVKNDSLTCRTPIPVEQYDIEGNFIAEYPSLMEASRKTGVPQRSISFVLLYQSNYAGGFVWKNKKGE